MKKFDDKKMGYTAIVYVMESTKSVIVHFDGFKDLKVKNNLKEPIRFTFLLEKNNLTIRINSEEVLEKNNIEFVKKNENEIITYINGMHLTQSYYK